MPVFPKRLEEKARAEARRTEAFAAAYERYFPDVVALCRRLVGDTEDAKAIAQEAFVRAWASIDRYSVGTPFWPWISTIARRLCINHLRSNRRGGRRLRFLLPDPSTTQPEEIAERREEHRVLLAAFRSLTPRERRLVLLRDVEGYSYDEIARFEDISLEAVRGALKRARAALRHAYSRAAGSLVGWLRWRRLRPSAGPKPWLATLPWVEVAAVLSMITATLADAPGLRGDSRGAVHVAAMATTPANTFGPSPTQSPMPRSEAGRVGISTTTVRTVPESPIAALLPVAPDDEVKVEDTVFRRIDAAPDGTFFAGGTAACPTAVSCTVLFRSTDGGRTWQRLPAIGYSLSRLLFAPSYPADPRMFLENGIGGLLVSEDDGATFRVAAPVPFAAAMSPGFESGDPTILLGMAPGWRYNAATGALALADLPSLLRNGIVNMAYSPDYERDGRFFAIAGETLLTCVHWQCAPSGRRPAEGTPALVVSPRFAEDGTVWAWSSNGAMRSTDRGATFQPVAVPASRVDFLSVDEGAAYVVARGAADTRLFRTRDGGATWELLGRGTALDGGAGPMATHRGTVVAARWPYGLMWSDDRGESWGSAS